MKISSFGKTDTGLRRSNNEDAYLLIPDLTLFAVADGVGGSAAGEVASRIFVDSVREVFERASERYNGDTSLLVQETFRLSNQRILNHAARNPDCKGMACTAEVVAFTENDYIVGHVGDSRTYLCRGGELRQITKDHSLVQSQLDQGLITAEEVKRHSLRNVVLRAVGVNSSMELDIIRGASISGDLFLICSDGLSDMVEDDVIRETLVDNETLQGKVERLIAHAKSNGGNDNITVVLCQISE